MVPWRTIFFGVNFAVAMTMIALTARWILDGSALDPFVLIVGCVMVTPFSLVAVAEWLFFSGRAPWLERPLGVVAGLVGALAVLLFVTNVGEGISQMPSPGLDFWFVFGAACFCVASYSFWCCWLRIRRRTLQLARGVGVVGAAP